MGSIEFQQFPVLGVPEFPTSSNCKPKKNSNGSEIRSTIPGKQRRRRRHSHSHRPSRLRNEQRRAINIAAKSWLGVEREGAEATGGDGGGGWNEGMQECGSLSFFSLLVTATVAPTKVKGEKSNCFHKTEVFNCNSQRILQNHNRI